MVNVKVFIELTVPQYLIITLISPIAAWLLITGITFSFELLLSMISLSFAMLGFNTLNMIFDKDLDKINKPLRPLPSGQISVKRTLLFMFVFYAISLPIAALGGIKLFLVIIAFIAISFFYTNPITRIKKYFWSSSIIGALIYGTLPFMTAWAISNKPLPWIFLFFFTFLIFFIAPSKDIEDIEGEKKT
ncbi:MAG: UbiA prenyltransferase family protein [Candidatus Aenigmarchaeota archaeon]|nr:UbiA prenyltransferase family protein [Candidatus Aenigmarchaeota archaeon]